MELLFYRFKYYFLFILLVATSCGRLEEYQAFYQRNQSYPKKAAEMETVQIDGRPFTMGDVWTNPKDSKYAFNARPVDVAVSSFKVGKYPVTAAQYCEFLNSEYAKQYRRWDFMVMFYFPNIEEKDGAFQPRAFSSTAPANCVSWLGAAHFCQWLSKKTGNQYRLPSEAEWELVASNGQNDPFPWGKECPGKTRDIEESYGERYLNIRDSRYRWVVAPVGSFPKNANQNGVMDMLAYKIGEWCCTKYEDYPTSETLTSTESDINDELSPRSLRGVSRNRFAFSWSRAAAGPLIYDGRPQYGFRVVQEINVPNIMNSKQ